MADNSISFALLARDMASPAFKRVGDSAKEADGKMGGIVGTAAKVGAALGGLALIKGVFTTGLQETKDYQAGLAQLQAGLKSTHGASGMTADGMEKLATKIQGYSGQTDDSIVKSESLLLTFRNIHDQTGKNNDIFTQATKATADMSARFGGDASDNAVKLGKALNDPVKGLGALSKMGVTFSESQKATIKQMVATGDTLGAQKLILGQVNAAVGGSAAAFGKTLPGQIEIAHRKFEDVSQTLVQKLTPAFSTVLTIVSKGIDFFGKYSQIILPIAGVIGTMVVAYKAWTAAQALLNIVMDANPIGLIVVAIAGLVVGLVEAWKHSETFRDIVKGALHVVSVAFNAVKTAAAAVFNWIKKNWPLLVGILTGPVGLAVVFIAKNWGKIKGVFDDVWHWVKDHWPLILGILTGPIGLAVLFVSKHFDQIKDIFRGAVDAIRGIWGEIEDVIKAPLRAVFGFLNNRVIGPINGVLGHLPGNLSLSEFPTFASGGLVRGPGTGTSDSILARVSTGETIIPAHLTPKYASALAADGVPGFAFGGISINPLHYLGEGASAVGHGIAKGASAVFGVGKDILERGYRWVIDHSIAPLIHAAENLVSGSNIVGATVHGALDRLLDALGRRGDKEDQTALVAPGGAGVQRWAGLVSQVLGMLGLSPILLGKVLSQMTTESGGNPGAINLTDSNAAAGHPSQGLMQVIPGTFAAYAGPFAGLGITNPLANIYAGLNYAMHRYGPGLAGLGEGHGYDSGGWLKPGVSLTYNGTGKPEAVLTHEQWQRVRSGGDTFIIQAWDGPSVDRWLQQGGAQKIAAGISRARANAVALPVN